MKKTKKNIGANDIWLLIFFLIHVAYITLCIFLPLPKDDEKSVLDVVMRTSAAVLVGFFLSKSFVAKKTTILSDKINLVRSRAQCDVIGSVGLFSLIMILVVRFDASTALPYNTIVQLRDFYLASIAFLMGTS